MIEYNTIGNDVKLFISDIPAGAGGSFMGYLQRVYMGTSPVLTEQQFPTLNLWDGAFLLNNGRGDSSLGGHRLLNIPFREGHWPGYFNFNYLDQNPDYSKEMFQRLSTHIQHNRKLIGRLKEPIGEQGQQAIPVYVHHFPKNVELYFKNFERVLTVHGTEEEHIRWHLLKWIKFEQKINIKQIKQQAIGNCTFQHIVDHQYPANVIIEWNKFFVEQDMNEIEKFFTTTLPIKDVNQERLDDIVEMIKIKNKLDNELIKEYLNEL